MATSTFFLVEKGKYSMDRFLGSMAVAAFHSNAHFYYEGGKYLYSDGELESALTYVLYDLEVDDNKIILYIDGENKAELNTPFVPMRGLDPSIEYSRVGCIEDAFNSERLLYDLVYEYLKRNPNDYYWYEACKWVFGLKDFEKLRKYPYDPDWLYKDPSLLE